MLTVQVKGIEELKRQLAGFSDRRFSAAISTALTRTVRSIEKEWKAQMARDLDRPTPFMLRATRVHTATAEKLQASVLIGDDSLRGGLSPAQVLAPHQAGGDRMQKKFEAALIAQGAMPAGKRAVPGAAAKLDAYGNVSRQQIVQVINQLGSQFSPGYARVIGKSVAKRIASAKRAGREYVAIPVGSGRLSAGIYERAGRRLRAVFVYVNRTQYDRRLTLVENGQAYAERHLNAEVTRTIQEHIAKLAAKGAR